MLPENQRQHLAYLFELIGREDELLAGVMQRLFGAAELDLPWFRDLLATELGSDRLESFTSKFARMQDNFVDKLLPKLLLLESEIPGSALDNLRKAERLGWLQNAEDWARMRLLRNKLVHEYVNDPAVLLNEVLAAKQLAESLQTSFRALRGRYGSEKPECG